MNAVAMIAALIAGVAICLAGWWLGNAGLSWIETHREVIALTQPWLFPAILTILVISALKRRRQARV